jgi:hypothetical protein
MTVIVAKKNKKMAADNLVIAQYEVFLTGNKTEHGQGTMSVTRLLPPLNTLFKQ